MDTFNVDESILNNMGDLSGVISGTQYQVGSGDVLPEGTNLSGIGDPNAPADLSQHLGNVAQPGQVVVQPGVVPQQQQTTMPVQQPMQQQVPQGVPDAERQRLEAIAQAAQRNAYEASMARIEAEEARFQAEIANLPDEEKEQRVLLRELEQAGEVNNWLNNQVQGMQGQMTQQQAEQRQRMQQSAKNQYGFLYAHRYGLPYENPTIRAALLAAENPDHMDEIAQGLVTLINQNVQATSQQKVNSGILAAGGGQMGPSTPQGPKPRSGDIGGLIASRQPTAVNWG